MEQTIYILLATWMLVRFGPMLARLMRRLYRSLRIRSGASIFEHNYIESKAFYMYRFKNPPSMTYIGEIDVTKAFTYMNEFYSRRIVDCYQSNYFSQEVDKQQFRTTLFVLSNEVMVELEGEYARIFYPSSKYEFADNLVRCFNMYPMPQKTEDFEINIITWSSSGLQLKRLDIKPMTLEIGLYYNDDFKEVDELIRMRLNQLNDKGIVLLHGLPGTGKTTYLRHLIGLLKKRVLFVSPSVAGNLMNPEFIDLLIDNPNTVLIIEDAENIIMDRKYDADSSVSNLLNLSDGLLSDCLSVQIICTFNNSLTMVDNALMRKGRLIAKYEFGKLNLEKSKELSARLGFTTTIEKPMTVAEITNQHEKEQIIERSEVVGFRRSDVVMN